MHSELIHWNSQKPVVFLFVFLGTLKSIGLFFDETPPMVSAAVAEAEYFYFFDSQMLKVPYRPKMHYSTTMTSRNETKKLMQRFKKIQIKKLMVPISIFLLSKFRRKLY